MKRLSVHAVFHTLLTIVLDACTRKTCTQQQCTRPHPDYERGSDALTDPSHLILRDGLFSTFQVNLSRSSSTEEDAILSHIRSSRGTKPRSWCPSPVGAGQAAVLPRSQSEESSLNRAVLESWRRTPDVSTSPCTN